MLKSRWLTTLAATFVIGFQTLPGAAFAITPQEIIDGMSARTSSEGFTGERTLRVYRQGTAPLDAKAKIAFADRDNYDIEITSPATIRGIKFHMKNGVNSAYFPEEKLFLSQGGKNTSYMPERVILSLFPLQNDLLKQNYDIKIIREEGINANLAYVVDFIPKNKAIYKDGNGKDQSMALTPRRRYWLEKDSFHVIKESRFWDALNPDGSWNFSDTPYSESGYVTFNHGPKPVINDLAPGGQLNKVNLSGKDKNSFLTYNSLEAARSAGVNVNLPGYLPTGFKLKDIQIFSLFGAQIKVLNFTDGLNDLMITVRPQQNAFVTLMAGAFSLNLIKKITDLSSQAPNNYYSTHNEKFIAVAFGDVPPTELERVALNLNY